MKILLIIISLLAFSTESVQAISLQDDSAAYNECKHTNLDYCDSVLTNGLESNQTTLFYMYSDNVGHYFLEPLALEENVVYVGHDDMMFTSDVLHHGKRFVGTFADDTLWELIDLEEVVYQ